MPAHPRIILHDQLTKLYLEKRLSTAAIAQVFGCNHVTILNYLNKYNIPRRSRLGNRKPVSIPKEILLDLYHKQKLTHKQIAKKLGHSRYGIQRWMKIYDISSKTYYETHKVYPKYDFSGNLVEKAYLIGFRLGDLNIYQRNYLIQARCSTTIQAQVDLFKQLFEQYGNVHIWKAKRGTWEIYTLLNKSFDFLLPKQDSIEGWILANNKYFLAFLAGYSDAEGSYFLHRSRPNVSSAAFEIQTYDKNIIQTVYAQLNYLGIAAIFSRSRLGGYIDKRGIKTNKDCWRLSIVKKQSLWNFIKLMEPYHQHTGKLHDISKVKDNLILRNQLPYHSISL